MGYSDDLDKVVNHEFERIRNLMKKEHISYKLPVVPNYYYVQLSEANVAIKEMF